MKRANGMVVLGLFLLGWVFTLGTEGFAADAEGKFAVRGLGAESCLNVTRAVSQEDENARREVIRTLSIWLSGYLTFANRATDARFDVVPFASDIDMLSIIVNHCESNPGEMFEAAAQSIVQVLSPFGVASMAPLAEIRRSVQLRQPTIVQLQQILIDRGLLQGQADGVVGDQTRSALRRLNAEKGTGEADEITVNTVLRLFSGD